MAKIKSLLLLSLFALVILPVPRSFGAEAQYEIAVLPQRPPEAMHARWMPLLKTLEKDLNIKINLKLFETMDEFEAYVKNNNPAFIYSTPAQLVYLGRDSKTRAYTPLVRANKTLSGAIFVKKDSPIKTVADLDGKSIAFVGKQNICSILTRDVLKAMNVKWSNVYAGTSQNVVKHVMLDKSEAGALLSVYFESNSPEMADLRIVYKTKPTAFHPLSSSISTPRSVQKSVVNAIMGLWNDKDGARMLEAVNLDNPIEADYVRDYKELEKIDFENIVR